jgi:hypothetical protein
LQQILAKGSKGVVILLKNAENVIKSAYTSKKAVKKHNKTNK